jgi:peroxiredoxin
MKLSHILIAVLVAFIAQAHGAPSVHLELPEELFKESLPDFTAKDREANKNFQKRHLLKLIEPETKRVALVYFATWCKPCVNGAEELKKARKKLEKKGILTVFVNVGEKDVKSVHKWIKKYADPNFPLIMDTRSQMVGPFGLLEPDGTVALPKILILDEKLKPLFLIGTEGDDFPEVLWKFNP